MTCAQDLTAKVPGLIQGLPHRFSGPWRRRAAGDQVPLREGPQKWIVAPSQPAAAHPVHRQARSTPGAHWPAFEALTHGGVLGKSLPLPEP